MIITIARRLPVLLGGITACTPPGLDPSHQRIAVVPPVRDDRPRVMARERPIRLRDIGPLTGCQDELDRVAQGVDGDVDPWS
jgi:hypothetical protein